MSDQILWGVDLGGTKMEGVVVRVGEEPEILARTRIPTEAASGYNHIIDQAVKLVELLSTETGLTPTAIGIGTPGTLDRVTNRIKNSNTLCLIDQPFKEDLERVLNIPVYMANDANCFALAESIWGAASHLKPETLFGVIMGTGVGSGIVVNGQILQGRHGIAGEWGHNPLDDSGPDCYCGKKGCVETIIAGPALERYYAELSGKSRPLKDIITDAQAESDVHAVRTLERLIFYFGKAIATIINILDPDVIVLGGGVGNVKELYTLGVEAIKPHLFNDALNTLFLKPKLGDSAGVFGAALLTKFPSKN